MKKQYKERRIYFSKNCEICGRPFQSFKRSKIKTGLCSKHRKFKVDENQMDMFASAEVKDMEVILEETMPTPTIKDIRGKIKALGKLIDAARPALKIK